MTDSVQRVMVKTIVKKAIRDIKIDPERTIRNLVDMALQFADSQFQKQFYSSAQHLLSNEQSGYYGLVKDSVSKVEEDTLLTFCMNLGYGDMLLVDSAISESPCWVGFDEYGQLNTENGIDRTCGFNIFKNDLPTILKQALPKKKT